MVNPAQWWCTGTFLEGTYYFDCYCPFGSRSMPTVFQRLSDAIRVIKLQRTPVEGLLGILDDFLGIVYRRVGESDEDLLHRGRRAAKAFDEELIKMGIAKQDKKDAPTAWETVWLGFPLNTKDSTLAIAPEKEEATIIKIQEEFFEDDGGLRDHASTVELGRIVGIFCYMSQA